MNNSLLPSGLQDLLPPDARKQSHIISSLMNVFEQFGYLAVIPPLVENTSTLLQGKGKALEGQTFRFADPISQEMMGIRADLTIQVSRIATTRLASSPLPLRLSYNGEVMRTKASIADPQRQLSQAGFELIGVDRESINAEYEAILLSLESLSSLGLDDVVVDLSYAGLLDSLLENSKERENILNIIKQKDLDNIPDNFNKSTLLRDLNDASGEALDALNKLNNIVNPPAELKTAITEITALVDKVKQAKPNANLTIDLLEHDGFEYQQGICFSLFLSENEVEAGRGGRYVINCNEKSELPLAAVGATLYVNRLLNIAYSPNVIERIYLPSDSSIEAGKGLRQQGYATIHGQYALSSEEAIKEAQKLDCKFILQGKEAIRLA